jgi:hypothetical protein
MISLNYYQLLSKGNKKDRGPIYLKVKGFKFLVEKVKNKASFIFDQSPELLTTVNEYLTESGSCEPLNYSNSIRNIKNLLYNT